VRVVGGLIFGVVGAGCGGGLLEEGVDLHRSRGAGIVEEGDDIEGFVLVVLLAMFSGLVC